MISFVTWALKLCGAMQAVKVQCAGEVEAVEQEVQHKQRQAARLLNAKAEEEAIKVSHTCVTEYVYMALQGHDWPGVQQVTVKHRDAFATMSQPPCKQKLWSHKGPSAASQSHVCKCV